MHFTLYLNVAGRLDKIGSGKFESAAQAFQTLASDCYKLPVDSEQFELNQIDERTFQILTAHAEYVLIEQINL